MATNFKEEVLKVYPDAVCKRYKQDMCAPFYVICREPLQLYSEHNSISMPRKKASNAWQNAYTHILNQKQ